MQIWLIDTAGGPLVQRGEQEVTIQPLQVRLSHYSLQREVRLSAA